ERPTSAKAGDTAVVLDDGSMVGFVGGECAEASVQAQALRALETGEPVLLRITPEAPGPQRADRGHAGEATTAGAAAGGAGTATGGGHDHGQGERHGGDEPAVGDAGGAAPAAPAATSGAVTVHNP